MPDARDMELLRDYCRHSSEDAFAELVQRHIALVYSIALRHTGIASQAEEITQAVFIVFARKAAGLRENTILEGWLYETTRLTALNFLRDERRRQFREQEAYMQSSTLQEPVDESIWQKLAPLLDEAMSRLGKKDRDAVILRFFRGKNVREVAATIQVSEAAAQRRILRALEKLRKFLATRGVSSTTAILAETISANSVQALPVGLAKTISSVAMAKGATASISTLTLIKGALNVMAWTKTKAVAAVAVVVVFATGTTALAIRHEHRNNRQRLTAGFSISANQPLKGHWTGSNTAHPGQTCTVNVSGDQIEYRGTDPNDWLLGTFVLNENSEPKQINITIKSDGTLPNPPAKNFIAGIYELQGDKITIAVAPHGSSVRPVNFTPGPQVDVLELQHD